jgi:hypothetical protein
MAQIDSNINNGGTTGHYLPLPPPSKVGCCYYVITNPNNENDSNDPCNYPESKGGYPQKETTYFKSNCVDKWNFYNNGNGAYDKSKDCSYGMCYYGYDSGSPVEGNSTSATKPNGTDTSRAIDNAIGELNNNVSHQNTQLGDKLDLLGKKIDDKNLTIEIDLNETNDLLRDINSTLSMQHTEELKEMAVAQESLESNVDKAIASYTTNFNELSSLISGIKPKNISMNGSCSIGFNVFGKHVDFSKGMKEVIPVLRPLLMLFMNIYFLVLMIKLTIVAYADLSSRFMWLFGN